MSDRFEDLPRRRKKNAAQGDQLPPHVLEAEQGALGCILIAPAEALDACDEAGVVDDWFYDLRHQILYHTMRSMHWRQPPLAIDAITLGEELRQAGHWPEFEAQGGYMFFNTLQDTVPSAANLPTYLELLRKAWQRRRLMRICKAASDQAMDPAAPEDGTLATAHLELLKIEESTAGENERSLKKILNDEVVPEWESHYTRGKAQIRGVTTGIETLDKIFCGLGDKHGNYHVLAARPGTGKTSLATQFAEHATQVYRRWVLTDEKTAADCPDGHYRSDAGEFFIQRTGIPVGISSLEMGAAALANKMGFQCAEADLQRWRTGFATDRDVLALTQGVERIKAGADIFIDDTPRLKIGQLKARWRRWHRQHGVRLFILDYLQLMQPDQRHGRPDRVQELADISAELQALGKELNCPMIVLAQMNRDYEKDPSRAPRMSDLKDCGAVEQDADTISFLYAPRLSDTSQEFFESAMQQWYQKNNPGKDWKKWDGRPQRINALVAKNRYGPTGKAELLFLRSSTKFEDWNVWLKRNGIKAAAAGESQYRDRELPGDDEPGGDA